MIHKIRPGIINRVFYFYLMMKKILVIFFSVGMFQLTAQTVPTFEQVLSLRSAGGPTLSPDGKMVAFSVQTADWNENRVDTEYWISKDGKKPFQLTNTPKGNSSNLAFSPDGQWIAFLSDRGSKTQIYVMRIEGGEPMAVTKEEESIGAFRWHPTAAKFIFLKDEKENKTRKEIEKRYGGFEQDDKEFTLAHLWQVDFNPELRDPSELPCYETTDSLKVKAGCIQLPKAQRLTEGKFTVTSFLPSPDGSKVAFSHQPDPLIITGIKSDISLLDLASKKISPLVTNPGTDDWEEWSPDSKELIYNSSLSDTTSNYYMNSKIFSINVENKTSRQMGKDFDENMGGFRWRSSGIYFSSWNKTNRPLYKMDPSTGTVSVFLNSPDQIFGFSFSKNGEKFAINARNGDQLNEVFISSTASPKLEKITDMSGQLSSWKVAQSEVISWKSKDGATIEGVLHKPANYDPSKNIHCS